MPPDGRPEDSPSGVSLAPIPSSGSTPTDMAAPLLAAAPLLSIAPRGCRVVLDVPSPGARSVALRGWALVRESFPAAAEEAEKKAASQRWKDTLEQMLRQIRESRQEHKKHTNTWQSINYSTIDNETCREEVRHRTDADTRREEHYLYVLVMVIGFATGLLCVGLVKGIDVMHTLKTEAFMSLWEENPTVSWAVLAASNAALFAGSACIVLFWQPCAAGSGIPEVKAYLNGVLLPKAFGWKIFVVKVISCALACSTGLPVGPEGPIIYLGGNIGHFLTSSVVLKHFPRLRYTNRLRTTAMTLGVTAGVSAAFAAPIGSLLFTVEEVASHFTTQLLWIAFLCSFMSYFVTIVLGQGLFGSGADGFSTEGLFAGSSIPQWQPREIVWYIVLGVILGLLGAIFNFVNVHIVNAWYRNKLVKRNRRRQVLEVVVMAVVLSAVWFYLPSLCDCHSKVDAFPGDENKDLRESTSNLWCKDAENEYNPLATLLFAGLDDVVRYLFLTGTSAKHTPFPTGVLLVYSGIFFIIACFIAGSVMATGIFIPMIVMGAGVGRAYGQLLETWFPGYVHGGFSPAGYAVIGAGGFIGGVTHICVSITVIMLEISNDLSFLLPIMMTIGVAKITADQIVGPLYDMILEMRHVPFLEPNATVAMQRLRCYQVMQQPVVSLPVCCSVRDICHVLVDTMHNGFPVVQTKAKPKFLGIITRAHLEVILEHIDYFSADTDHHEDIQRLTNNGSSVWLSDHPAAKLANHLLATQEGAFKHRTDLYVEALAAPNKEIDLQKWMNRAPLTVRQLNSVERAFNVMKNFGLRHLPVVNSDNMLVGFLTRHDLFHIQHHPSRYEHQARQRHLDFTQIRERSGPLSPSAGQLGDSARLAVQPRLPSRSASGTLENDLDQIRTEGLEEPALDGVRRSSITGGTPHSRLIDQFRGFFADDGSPTSAAAGSRAPPQLRDFVG